VKCKCCDVDITNDGDAYKLKLPLEIVLDFWICQHCFDLNKANPVEHYFDCIPPEDRRSAPPFLDGFDFI